ncbi:asparaginase [Bacillus piscicola]|uniref:asparaginase n=1 Tax=Bacillus piscicola TaxID=1632684 RepID=UPI001F099785|nr:asparaginase [Bacillus piscicola]
MKKIIVIHTGGTIAMKEDKRTGTVSQHTDSPLHEWNGHLPEAEIKVNHFANVPSPHMTPARMFELYTHLTTMIKTENADGVVITHGTDTLEETAYILDLLHTQKTPVILTGAMHSSNEELADGPHNYHSALRTALSDHASGMGVLVVMNEEIHAARHVVKTDAANIAAFKSPAFGPVGSITRQEVMFHCRLPERAHVTVSSLTKKVPLVKTYAGMEASMFSSLIAQSIDGVVIEAMGIGNVPPAIVPALDSLLENGIPVVLTSRCISGYVQPVYDYEGGGRKLQEAGVIFAKGLSGPKARLHLLAALEAFTSTAELRQFFEEL